MRPSFTLWKDLSSWSDVSASVSALRVSPRARWQRDLATRQFLSLDDSSRACKTVSENYQTGVTIIVHVIDRRINSSQPRSADKLALRDFFLSFSFLSLSIDLKCN